MSDVRLKLLSPWVIFFKKVSALFDGDPQLTCAMNYDGPTPSIVISCSNGDKVTALQQILPESINYGGVELDICIDGTPSNRAFLNKKELFETAFENNPVFAYAFSPVEDVYNWFDMTYVVFKNCVVQFFADNLNDCHGVISTLYQDIASDVLTGPSTQGVYFNTDIERGAVGKPLGEWP